MKNSYRLYQSMANCGDRDNGKMEFVVILMVKTENKLFSKCRGCNYITKCQLLENIDTHNVVAILLKVPLKY